jgi:hypothetical protein
MKKKFKKVFEKFENLSTDLYSRCSDPFLRQIHAVPYSMPEEARRNFELDGD